MSWNGVENGEFRPTLNGVRHWVKVMGAEHRTLPLIVIHGGPGGNHYVFERTTAMRLAEERTIILYEQRGCGRSEAAPTNDGYSIAALIADFRALCDWLPVEEVDLLGCSFGAELALEFALAERARVRTLVLSAPTLVESGIQYAQQVAGFMAIAKGELYDALLTYKRHAASLEQLCDFLWQQADNATVDALLFENQAVAHYCRSLWHESGFVNSGFMARTIKNTKRPVPLELRLHDVTQPTLLIVGVFDRNTGVPVATKLHRHIAHSELRLFTLSAHFPELEEEELFAKSVEQFLIERWEEVV